MESKTDLSLIDAALFYVESLDWAVFPCFGIRSDTSCSCNAGSNCKSPGKHPITDTGFKEATNDPRKVRSWWEQYPEANVAVATGSISGFDVLDIDPRNGGDRSISALETRFGLLPSTLETKTGGGGRHLFFQHQQDLRNKVDFQPGLDVRAEGGYVIAPPSRHANGQHYEFSRAPKPEKTHIAPWPAALFAMLYHPRENTMYTDSRHTIPQGRRNSTLASLAGTMQKRGMTKGAIAAALLTDNRERCKPPLEDQEVIRIAESIAKYAPDEPASSFVSSVPISINGTSETNIDLKPISAHQLITEAPETQWQIEGILPTGSAMVVVADAGVGKTWLMHDLAVAIDQDRKWIGHFPVSQGKVLIIDEENAIALIKKRLQKLLKGHALPEDGSELKVQFLAATGMDLSSEAYVAELQTVLETMRPDLVIIDALVRIHTNNENDAGEMASLFGIFKRWMNEYGCSFVFCHHQRKPGPIGNAPSTMYRGSSEIRAFVDTHLDLRKSKSQEGVFTVDHVKSRYAEPVAPFDVEIFDLGEDAIQLRHLGDSSARIEDKLDKATEFIQSLMEDGQWHSRQEIEEKGKTHSITRDILDKARISMVKSGELEETQEGKKKVFRSAKLRSDAPSIYIGTEETNQQQNLTDFSPTTDG